jgi:CheY-like chemotaxis protein
MTNELDGQNMEAVLRAVQAITSEIDVTRLLHRLLHILAGATGAERGLIVRRRGDALEIEAALPEPGPGTHAQPPLPAAFLREILNAGDASARTGPAGIADDYFQKNRPASVIGMPIGRRAPWQRALYLEHGSAAEAFDAPHRRGLDWLTAQAGISLENAELYERLRGVGQTAPQDVAATGMRGRPAETKALAGARILLVEDNDINREVAVALMEPLGLRVSIAIDGRQALEMLEREAFDLVLLDCYMPVMDGFETARAIRAQPRFAKMPVVSITGHAKSGDRELALAAGMDDYLAKPLDPGTLARTLKSWIHLRPPASPLDGLPGVDLMSGRRQTLGNDALYTRLLVKFRETNRQTATSLRQAIATGAIKQARYIAHTLQGTALTLGLKTVAGPALTLDQMLREGLPAQPPEEALGELEREMTQLLAVLERLPAAA